MRRVVVVNKPFRVFRETVGSRMMNEGEEPWAEYPLSGDQVTVYLDNVPFLADRKTFEASVSLKNPDK